MARRHTGHADSLKTTVSHRIHWWADTHRSAKTNLRLGCTLCGVAGATNAGGFLAVGQYTSHMSGIVSSVADNLVLGKVQLAAAGVALVLAFVLGSMTTVWIVNWSQRRQMRSALRARCYWRPLCCWCLACLVPPSVVLLICWCL